MYFGSNVDTSTQYGLRYRINNAAIDSHFATRAIPTTMETVSTSTVLVVGADTTTLGGCGCTINYVTMYTDYLATSEDEMLNLGLMDTNSTEIFLLFLVSWRVYKNRNQPAQLIES